MADATVKFLTRHVAQTPMVMHFEKALMDQLYENPLCFLVLHGPSMLEDYKKCPDKIKGRLKKVGHSEETAADRHHY